MNPLIQLSLFLTLALVSQAAITDFWDAQGASHKTLQCLKEAGYLEQAFVLTVLNKDSNSWTTNIQLQQIEKLGTTPQVIVSTSQLTGRLPPHLEAHKIYRQFQDSPVLKFWISISNFLQGFKPSCDYLTQLAHFLELYTKTKVGIQTEPMFWEDLFGDVNACPQLGKHDLFMSFNDFSPFGGWTSYSYYETYQYVDVCGYPGMQVFKP